MKSITFLATLLVACSLRNSYGQYTGPFTLLSPDGISGSADPTDGPGLGMSKNGMGIIIMFYYIHFIIQSIYVSFYIFFFVRKNCILRQS